MITIQHFLRHGRRLYIKGTEAYIDSRKYPVGHVEAEELAESLTYIGSTSQGFKVFENRPNGNLAAWQIRALRQEALVGADPMELCFRYSIDNNELEKLAGKELVLAKISYLRELADLYTDLADKLEKT